MGVEQFGNGQRKPRAIQEPGTFYEYNDVRINRFSLSLLRLFGKGLPEVLKTAIMDPIGASQDWRWHGYANSNVEIEGRQIASVSGGTRWGGGLWMNSEDLARFGLLILNHGKWGDRQIVSAKWLKDAVTPSAHGPDYGYLWWLNTQKKQWPSAPGVELRRARQRLEHHLDRSRARHRLRLALVPQRGDGRNAPAHRRLGEPALTSGLPDDSLFHHGNHLRCRSVRSACLGFAVPRLSPRLRALRPSGSSRPKTPAASNVPA